MSSIGVDGLITFLYYKDLKKATAFYEGVMGFKLKIDQKWAKIYEVAESAHVGLVDESHGYHKASPMKPVMVTLLVPDVDAWYRYLKQRGVETINEPHNTVGNNIRSFLLRDPEGYVIEIQKFL